MKFQTTVKVQLKNLLNALHLIPLPAHNNSLPTQYIFPRGREIKLLEFLRPLSYTHSSITSPAINLNLCPGRDVG